MRYTRFTPCALINILLALSLSRRNCADIGICRQIFWMRVLAAGRTIRIAEQTQFTELTRQRIISHQATNQWITNAQQHLDCLCCLQQANNTRKHSQYACLCTAWGQGRRRRLGIETTIARTFVWLEDGQLTLE